MPEIWRLQVYAFRSSVEQDASPPKDAAAVRCANVSAPAPTGDSHEPTSRVQAWRWTGLLCPGLDM